MQQVPYQGFTNMRGHYSKFSGHGAAIWHPEFVHATSFSYFAI